MLTLKQVVSPCHPQHIEITEGPSSLEVRIYLLEAKSSLYPSHSIPIHSKSQHHLVNRILLKTGQMKRRQETTLLRLNRMLKLDLYRSLRVPRLRKTTPAQLETIICAQCQMLLPADRSRRLRPLYNQNSRSRLRHRICRDTTPREVKTSDCRMLPRLERRLQVVPLLEPILHPVLLNNEVHN